MMIVAENVEEIVRGVRCVLESDCVRPDVTPHAAYFFRGESRNFLHPHERHLETAFPCRLDRYREWIDNERRLYEDALRHNVISFEQDKTMVERIARMQHYQLPTRFAAISDNAFLAAHFACDSSGPDSVQKDNGEDGFIRILKVHPDKMKSFTSDIIVSIAHLPLVNACNVNPSQKDGLGYLRYEVATERMGFDNIDEWADRNRTLCEEIQQVWAFRPILNTQRIRNQGGAFLAFGCHDGKASLNPSFNPDDYDDHTKPSWGIAQVG